MILLIGLTCFVLLLIHQFWYRRLNFPNGPMPLPLIGNFLGFINHPRWEDKFLEWKEKYGPIYTMWLGLRPVITVNDYETAIKLFVNEAESYSDRPDFDHFNKLARGGVYGIGQPSGPMWQEQRRASLKILRDFGMGKNYMQERILQEVQTICESINKEIESGLAEHDVNKITDIAIASVINSLICGFRFTTDDKAEGFYKLKFYSNEFVKYFTDPLTNLGINNESIANFPIIKSRMMEMVNVFDQLFNYIDPVIEEHKKNNDYDSGDFEPRDFIDAYLLEMNKAKKSGIGREYYTDKQLRNIVLDFWLAGQETTSTTVQWAIAFLIRNQDVQQKVHKELDTVIGSDRLITVADRVSLPYINATVLEIQRCANLAIFNVPRAVGKDVTLNGCLIKKGTMIFPQISVIMADPKNFPDPHKFNPDRFINADGQFVNNEKVMPFSLGKRICLGESLAKLEIMLFAANLFNQYKFFAGSEPPTLNRRYTGGTSMCEPYKCCVVKRY